MTEYVNTLKLYAGRKLGLLHSRYIKYFIIFHQLYSSFCLRSIFRCLFIRYLTTCINHVVRNSHFNVRAYLNMTRNSGDVQSQRFVLLQNLMLLKKIHNPL